MPRHPHFNQKAAADAIFFSGKCNSPWRDCRLPTRDLRRFAAGKRLPAPVCRFPWADCHSPSSGERLPGPDCRLPRPEERLPEQKEHFPALDRQHAPSGCRYSVR